MHFEKWIPVDLLRLPGLVTDIGMPVFTGDSRPVRIGAVVTRGGESVTLSGTVFGLVTRPDGTSFTFEGSLGEGEEADRAWIDLPEAAFAVPGRITAALRLHDGDEKTVLLAVSATVRRADTDTAVDPEEVIPAWDGILGKVLLMEQAASSCGTAAARAEAAADSADGRLNALHGLVDYGYAGSWEGSNGSAVFTRIGTHVTADGLVASGMVNLFFKLNGTPKVINKGTGVTLQDAGLTLRDGGRYRLRCRVTAGTYSGWTSATIPFPVIAAVYRQGDLETVNPDGRVFEADGRSSHADFTYTDAAFPNGVYIGLIIRRTSGNRPTFEGLGLEVMLEDLDAGLPVRLPDIPAADGTYTLRLTVADGQPVCLWAAP
ncbi:MAG: hypothetical protein IKS31_08120 [Clostridia bacterium]|nr:hypothetical protein [Clostridia bacterium]